MAAFFADIDALEKLYMENKDAMFCMAFLHASNSNDANEIIKNTFFRIYMSKKEFEKVTRTPKGIIESMKKSISDYYRKRARKNIKTEKLQALSLPFPMTDELVAILHTSDKYKSALALHYGADYTIDETAKALHKKTDSIESLFDSAQKSTKLNDNQLREAISSIRLDDATHQRLWDKIFYDIKEHGFPGKQRLRNFKRNMDIVVPYAAGAIILFCAFAFAGVHYGWFSGVPFEKSTPLEGLDTSVASDDIIYRMENYDYDESSDISESSNEKQKISLSVYVPDGDSLVEYVVKDTPNNNSAVISQLERFGLISGSAVLSVDMNDDKASSSTLVNLELLNANSIDALTLEAIAKTMSSLTGSDNISVTVFGEELIISGKSARDMLENKTEIKKTTETTYAK